jgi:hypothetical protein
MAEGGKGVTCQCQYSMEYRGRVVGDEAGETRRTFQRSPPSPQTQVLLPE